MYSFGYDWWGGFLEIDRTVKIQNLSSVNVGKLRFTSKLFFLFVICFTKFFVTAVSNELNTPEKSQHVCLALGINFMTQWEWLFFQSYLSIYVHNKMANGIWCLITLKILSISDLLRITDWTWDGDLNWSFRLGPFEKDQFQKHILTFANFCNEFISINFWHTVDSLLFCFVF